MKKHLLMAMWSAALLPGLALAQLASHTEATSCSACHAPHGAGLLEGVPLWDTNHDLSGGDFIMYAEDPTKTVTTTLDASIPAEPDGSSRLCLSCHDGAPTDHVPGLAHDLSDSHPISFVYDSALATTDGELHDPATTQSFLPGSTDTIFVDLLQSSGKMQCVSCHDIHSSGVTVAFLYNIKGEVEIPGFGGSINSTALCQACHDK